MYFEDTPIKNQKEDLLNRKNFSQRLAKALVETTTTEGYCLGLYGPWGSGKSSIVNMVIENIEVMSEKLEDPPIVMFFNPWNFSSKEQLLNQYFVMLADKFCDHKNEKLNNIGKEIKKYSGMLDVFGEVGKLLSFGGKVASAILEQKSGAAEDNNISKQRDKIVKALSEQDCKVIIVIDDIDRLTNEEIRLIFQLVNSVAKFPNTIYLLSFDKEVVVEALSDVQSYNGDKYLEKIVQVPINIPEVSREALWDILYSRLNRILDSHTGMIFNNDLWSQVFYDFISKFIKNVRDVIRLTNTLTVKCDMIGSEINFVDMIMITLIETKMPHLYTWIKDNKGLLVGSERQTLKMIGKNEQEIAEFYMRRIDSLDPTLTEEYVRILKFLFPYFSSKIEKYPIHVDRNTRRQLRVGNADIFDRYFVLDMTVDEIPRTEFDYAMMEMGEEKLKEYIKYINSKGAIINFLKEIEAIVNDISEDRVSVVIKALIKTAHEFAGSTSNGWFELSSFNMTLYKIRDLIMRINNEDERANLLEEIIDNANKDSVQVISHFINIIELAHGRLAANGQENGGEKVISLTNLELLETKILKKIKEISNEFLLLDFDHSRMVLHLYRALDVDGYNAYMKKHLTEDLNKLKYLSFSVHKWKSGTSIGWECHNEFKEFLSAEEIDSAFDECLKNDTLWLLDEDDIHRAVAFRYWRNSENAWHGDVSDKEVIDKIQKLKNYK